MANAKRNAAQEADFQARRMAPHRFVATIKDNVRWESSKGFTKFSWEYGDINLDAVERVKELLLEEGFKLIHSGELRKVVVIW